VSEVDDESEYVRPVARLLVARDVDGLIALLTDESAVGRHAASALAEIGSDALPALQEALEADNGVVAGWAAVALAEAADEGSEERLLGVVAELDCAEFSGPLFEVWEAAVVVLGQRKVKAAVDTLIKLLRCQDTDVREAVAWSLGTIGDARAVDPLARLLLEEEVSTLIPAGWWIADALKSLGGEKAERSVAQWEGREEAWFSANPPSR
jgi:HEAT repeat protein